MSHAEEFVGLAEFLADRGSALLGTAVLLAGTREAGEDLLQLALERLLRRWQRIDGDPEAYLRRTLYHLAVDRWRWRARHPEVSLTTDVAHGCLDPSAVVDLREAVMQALASLPARQRAVLVLRYYEQLPEAEIAELLGCSAGTVKSSAARGLRRLRTTVAAWGQQVRDPVTAGGPATTGRHSEPATEGLRTSTGPDSLAKNGAKA